MKKIISHFVISLFISIILVAIEVYLSPVVNQEIMLSVEPSNDTVEIHKAKLDYIVKIIEIFTNLSFFLITGLLWLGFFIKQKNIVNTELNLFIRIALIMSAFSIFFGHLAIANIIQVLDLSIMVIVGDMGNRITILSAIQYFLFILSISFSTIFLFNFLKGK